MRTYVLKDYLPAWHFDPATNRQLKVLRFFGVPIDPALSKGRAGGIIGRLFSDPVNKHLWTAYIYTTGDEDDATTELRPHDRAALAQVVIPEEWRPRPRSTISNERRKALEIMVLICSKKDLPLMTRSQIFQSPESALHSQDSSNMVRGMIAKKPSFLVAAWSVTA